MVYLASYEQQIPNPGNIDENGTIFHKYENNTTQ